MGSQGVLVDLDGDGDLDLTTLAGSSGTNRLFLNDGRGGFVDATLGRLPPVLSSSDLGDVVAADVDRDGDLDLMVSRGYFQNPETVVLLLNDGTARFTEAPDRMPGTRLFDRLAVADVDQDADPDLIAGGFLFINDGRGFFRDETTTRWPGRWLGRYSPQDVDGDGDVDVLGIGGSEAWLLLNDGRGNFADGSAGRLPGRLFPEAWIDVDLDGDPDLLFGDVLYLNDGRGAFSAAPVPRIPPLCRGFADTAVDVDGDGDRDLVGTRLLLNDGRGLFHDATAESCLGPYPTYQPDKALAGDLDTDGRVDQVILCGNEAARLYLQDASGSFQEQTLARLPAGLGYVRTGDLGDVDGDLDLDLVLVGQRMTVLLNDGTGRFVDGGTDAAAGREHDPRRAARRCGRRWRPGPLVRQQRRRAHAPRQRRPGLFCRGSSAAAAAHRLARGHRGRGRGRRSRPRPRARLQRHAGPAAAQ